MDWPLFEEKNITRKNNVRDTDFFMSPPNFFRNVLKLSIRINIIYRSNAANEDVEVIRLALKEKALRDFQSFCDPKGI